MAVYTPTDKRFHRAHVKPSRRRRVIESRRRLFRRVCFILLFGFGIYWASTLLMRSSFLRIETILVEGNKNLSDGEVLSLVDQLQGENVVVADLEVHRERLLSSGWVKQVTLRRLLPSTIEVLIDERQPIGLGRFSDRLYLIDEVGTVIDEYGPRFSDFDLPIIDGLSTQGNKVLAIDTARAKLAARVIDDLHKFPELASYVSQIDVRDAYDAVVLLSDEPTFIHLGNQRFAERLQEYLELAPALRAQVPYIDYVDLRFERRIYVRPAESRNWESDFSHLTSMDNGDE